MTITYKNIEDLLVTLFSELLGLDPNAGELRVAYNREATPNWEADTDVLTFYLTTGAGILAEDVFESEVYNESEDKFDVTDRFTDIIESNISIYGPNCRDLARKLQIAIQSDNKRLELTRNGIYPVLKTPPPRYVPYRFNNQWWQRADLALTFNVQNEITTTVERITSAEISTTTDTGVDNNVIINTTS